MSAEEFIEELRARCVDRIMDLSKEISKPGQTNMKKQFFNGRRASLKEVLGFMDAHFPVESAEDGDQTAA